MEGHRTCSRVDGSESEVRRCGGGEKKRCIRLVLAFYPLTLTTRLPKLPNTRLKTTHAATRKEAGQRENELLDAIKNMLIVKRVFARPIERWLLERRVVSATTSQLRDHDVWLVS